MSKIKLKYLCRSFSSALTIKELTNESNDRFPVYGATGLIGYKDSYDTDVEYLGIVKDGAGVGRINIYPSKSSLLGTMATIVPNNGINIKWLQYAITNLNLGESIDKATIPHIYFSVYGNSYIRDISNSDQQKIADYLDRNCSQIDALIANQEAQIEKLKAYKQSLITEVVTKGLDPNAPMKDSGVEWIGKIPKHWRLSRIKNLFELRNERNSEADLNKVNLISLYTDLGVVQHSDIVETTGNRAVTASGYKKVYKDDIVVNIILCWMGAVGKSDYDGVTSPAYDIYKPKPGVNSDYYHYLFRTKRFNGECFRYGRGIMMMRWRTYSTEFTSIDIPVPPDAQQQEIAEYLTEKSMQIDKLISIKQTKIEKLNQYKKSLIYEYVTGKKEVMA